MRAAGLVHRRPRACCSSAIAVAALSLTCTISGGGIKQQSSRAASSTSTPTSVGVVSALNIAVITGTTRTSPPPRPILGPRISSYICQTLEDRGHSVSVIDPRTLQLPLLEKPHFAYARSQIPTQLAELHEILVKADAYVTITPEYNHAPSPALLNILNHFGSSVFSWKPSAIVSYSAGQWGGSRAAIALRPILSELGCLPVSALVHVPNAGSVFDEDGSVIGDEEEAEKWLGYVGRCISQLEWWGKAAKAHRSVEDPNSVSPAFRANPSQRNAPS
eukprot:CAMPEP_0181033350 /NCGR_PEP_ID=MMETSP1070-20121207/7210_1 /TAXON_ID=265543 /ORGANISM="Minutocellus polymorphus, Strain NH13" /LENGTH=275 /DNA_ID=CAMNT_0023110771 /DNA_START=25 /DNA_END=852 /DNA_ORIENTATION=-